MTDGFPRLLRDARVLLMIVIFLGLAAPLARAQSDTQSWTGSWDTRWPEGGARIAMEQQGDRVTGTYPLYDGQLEGRVSDRTLTGTWRTGADSGPFEFVMSVDGESFMGRFGDELWWTGARMPDADEPALVNLSQDTPEQTLRAFLLASDAVENEQLEYLDTVMSLLDFGNLDLGTTDELEEATMLWLVIDQFRFSLEDIRKIQPEGDSATVPLTRFDGETYDLDFVRRDGKWFLLVPPPDLLAADMDRLFARFGGRVPPANSVFGLQTPRDTLEAFIDSMRVGPGGLDTAVDALDLSALSPVGRDREAVLLAQYLEQVLARLGEVVYQEIPNDPESETPFIFFTHPEGDIVIAPTETEAGVQWKFTPETLRSIRALYSATEDLPPPPYILPLYRPDMATFFQIRDVLSGSVPEALEPLGPLEIWQWLAIVAVFVAAFVATLIISVTLRTLLGEGWAGTRFLTWGLRLLAFGVVSYAGLDLLGLPDSFASIVLAIAVISMIAGAIPLEFWIVDAIRDWLDRSKVISEHSDILASLLVGLVKVAIVLGNLLLLAEALDVPYGAALAGFGIGGLAVALAARSTLENVIAGFILFADRPLKVGDFCRFGSEVGTVERIGIRSTMIRTLDRTVVAVPNADFVNMHLENYARRDQVLLRRTLVLRHDTTPDQVRYVLGELRNLIVAHPRVVTEGARARFSGFSAQGAEIDIHLYVGTADWAEFLGIAEDLMLRVMELVAASGTGFAMPTRTLQIGRDPGRDADLSAAAEAHVADWRARSVLPFPDLPPEEAAKLQGTLPYPPEGAPQRPEAPQATAPVDQMRARGRFWSLARGAGLLRGPLR